MKMLQEQKELATREVYRLRQIHVEIEIYVTKLEEQEKQKNDQIKKLSDKYKQFLNKSVSDFQNEINELEFH